MQIIPDYVDIKVFIRWIAFGEDWLDRFAEFYDVFVYHALNDLKLIDYFHTSGAFELRASNWNYEADEAGFVEDELVHKNMQKFHNWSLGIQKSGNITKKDISFGFLDEIGEEGLRNLLMAYLKASKPLLFIDEF